MVMKREVDLFLANDRRVCIIEELAAVGLVEVICQFEKFYDIMKELVVGGNAGGLYLTGARG